MIATLTIKQLTANKMRFLATGFAVILGVAFLAGTLILTDTIRGTLNGALAEADAGTDAYVRGSSAIELGYGQTGRPIDAKLLDTIRRVDGVDQATIKVSGYAQIVDKAGKAVGTPNTGLLAMNWVTVSELNPFVIVAGRAPSRPDEIAIDKHSATVAKLQVGDRTTVLSTHEPRPATVVGITKFGHLDTPGATSIVLFDNITAQKILNAPGEIDAIAVTARNGVTPEKLVSRLAPLVGPSNEVITGAQLTKEHQRQIDKNIDQFGTFLTIFALIALFVGAFIINNTFSIIVSQRTKEMALLRAVGATGRQVRLAVLAEAAVTGLVASSVGLVAGIGLAKGLQALLSALGIKIPLDNLSISPSTAIVSVAVGFVITLVSAVFPARRASRVAPIAALRDVAQDRSAVSTTRIISGGIATAAAVATLVIGLNAADIKIVGAGAFALFLAVSILGPVLARPVAAAFGYPMARLRGTAGVIAQQNAMRNPKRTARTASSLMIGVALVSLLTIFAETLKSSGGGSFRRDYQGTAIIDSGAIASSSGLSPKLAASIKTLPGVRSVAEQRNSAVEINGTPNILYAYDTTTIAQLFDLGHIDGDLSRLGTDGIAVKAGKTGKGENTIKLGDTRDITFSSGKVRFTVRAIYERGTDFFGHQFVDLSAFQGNVPVTIDSRIYVNTDDVNSVDRAAAAYPTAKVLTTEAFISEQNANIDTILTLMYALLGLAVLIALLGIANTLALSIHERKRELGLLRAVGMTKAQVRSSVRWESVIIAMFGTVLGLVVGTFLGAVMVSVLIKSGVGSVVIPVESLVVISAIAAAAGVIAALMPARRAARIDILKAVATA
jgi:putative ABC transport system permease protein